MSVLVLPSLIGLGIESTRSPMWSTNIQTAVSGKETGIGLWSYPRYTWDLTWNVMRANNSFTEFQNLFGFFNARQGRFDSFLFTDPDDNSVTLQQIATGDGATLAFQLVRTYGGYIEPMFAPNVVSSVTVNGSVVSPANYSVSPWGSTTPGVLTFTAGHAPGAGQAVAATFTYYFPCRFNDDTVDFKRFLTAMYSSEIKIISKK